MRVTSDFVVGLAAQTIILGLFAVMSGNYDFCQYVCHPHTFRGSEYLPNSTLQDILRIESFGKETLSPNMPFNSLFKMLSDCLMRRCVGKLPIVKIVELFRPCVNSIKERHRSSYCAGCEHNLNLLANLL